MAAVGGIRWRFAICSDASASIAWRSAGWPRESMGNVSGVFVSKPENGVPTARSCEVSEEGCSYQLTRPYILTDFWDWHIGQNPSVVKGMTLVQRHAGPRYVEEMAEYGESLGVRQA